MWVMGHRQTLANTPFPPILYKRMEDIPYKDRVIPTSSLSIISSPLQDFPCSKLNLRQVGMILAICLTLKSSSSAPPQTRYIDNLLVSNFPTHCYILTISYRTIPFKKISTKSLYLAHLAIAPCPPPKHEKWNLVFRHMFPWHLLLHYIHNHIVDCKSREILYKLYSCTIMVETHIHKFDHPSTCPHCTNLKTPHFLSCPSTFREAYIFFCPQKCHSSYFLYINSQTGPH